MRRVQLEAKKQVELDELLKLPTIQPPKPHDEDEASKISSNPLDSAVIPCFYVPFRQNQNLHDRDLILDIIEPRLANRGSLDFIPSAAIGRYAAPDKTQLA